jgi:hypothetical protein
MTVVQRQGRRDSMHSAKSGKWCLCWRLSLVHQAVCHGSFRRDDRICCECQNPSILEDTSVWYIYVWNGQSRAGEWRCSQAFFFRYEIRVATAAVPILRVLGITSTYVSHFSFYFAVRPANWSSLRMWVYFRKVYIFVWNVGLWQDVIRRVQSA